jgi:putative sterol carrier protein
MSDIENVFNKLKDRFNPEAAEGMDVIFQFQIDNEVYHLKIKHSECELVPGEHDDPNITLIMDQQTFSELSNGQLKGMQAYMSGKLKAEGNLILATRLGDLFSI